MSLHRFGCETSLHVVMIGWLVVTCTSAFGADARADAMERERLQQSLTASCQQFLGDDHWNEADKCRRAWFSEHEEAVWRLKLNPHGHQSGPPS